MTKLTSTSKKPRKQPTSEFRLEALNVSVSLPANSDSANLNAMPGAANNSSK